ncbi:MAG: VWA domain-containing protein [Acidobacteriota bacterium]
MVIFAQPERLWLLFAVVGVTFLVLVRHRSRLANQRALASPAVWDRLIGGAPATGVWRMVLWCAAAALIVLALARPQWGAMPDEVSIRTRDLVLALDVSDSMQCPDLQPNRLGRSLEIIRRALPGLGGNRIGVVVFAGEAYSLIPLTTDLEAVASFLDGVRPGMVGRPGSNLEAAVGAAVRLLPPEGEGRVVVLFSDGENLQGRVDAAASVLQEAGAGLLGVVVGTERGGPIPALDASGAVHYKKNKEGQPVVTRAETATFEMMAEKVGGEVLVADGAQTEKDLIAAVESLRTREVQTEQKPRKIERFSLFLIAAALMVIGSFLLSPWRRRAAAVLVFLALGVVPAEARQSPPPVPVAQGPVQGQSAGQAQEPEPVAWWQKWIPGGSRRLARAGMSGWEGGDAEKAVKNFGGAAQLDPENPERVFDLGTALAAQGAAEPAIALLTRAEEGGVAGSSYNAGTAALGGEQAEMAVEFLRRALLADGGNPEVKRNFELALKMQQEQQEQEQENQEQNEDQEDDQEQEEQEQQEGDEDQQQPTPTPNPSGEQGPQPTPTPDPNGGLFDALDRAEAEAREAMQTPAPQSGNVEKDW